MLKRSLPPCAAGPVMLSAVSRRLCLSAPPAPPVHARMDLHTCSSTAERVSLERWCSSLNGLCILAFWLFFLNSIEYFLVGISVSLKKVPLFRLVKTQHPNDPNTKGQRLKSHWWSRPDGCEICPPYYYYYYLLFKLKTFVMCEDVFVFAKHVANHVLFL